MEHQVSSRYVEDKYQACFRHVSGMCIGMFGYVPKPSCEDTITEECSVRASRKKRSFHTHMHMHVCICTLSQALLIANLLVYSTLESQRASLRRCPASERLVGPARRDAGERAL